MGQHGRNRTGSDATRGNRVFETERHDEPVSDTRPIDEFAPAQAAPWDVQGRPPPGIVGSGPMPIAGSPDVTPREGFDGVNRRVEQATGWEGQERRRAPWTYERGG